jgi:predicted  nucleic acid-binding Zn-ribbon protein
VYFYQLYKLYNINKVKVFGVTVMSDENTQTIIQALNELRVEISQLNNVTTRIDNDLKDTSSKLIELTKKLDQTQKRQDRTWDVVKWVGEISAGLSISAAIALVGLVIRLAR